MSATLFPRKVQGSLARSDNERVSTELARDMMARENWYVLRNGWVCALKVEGKWVTFTPFAPDFMTAARAMIGLKWIHRKTETSIPFIDWGAGSWRMPLQRRDFSVRGTRAAEVYPEQT